MAMTFALPAKRKASPRPFTNQPSPFKPAAHTVPTVNARQPVLSNAERRQRADARKSNAMRPVYWHTNTDNYHCPELARNPGIPIARYAAYDLPSRAGDWLYYPDGRVEPFPGSKADLAAQAAVKLQKQ